MKNPYLINRILVNAHLMLIMPPFYWLFVEAVPKSVVYFGVPIALVLYQARFKRFFSSLNNLKLSTLALACSSGASMLVTYSKLPAGNVGTEFYDFVVAPFLILLFILFFYFFVLNDVFNKDFYLYSSGKFILIGQLIALVSLTLPFLISWVHYETFNLDLLILGLIDDGINPIPFYLRYYEIIGGTTSIGPICAVYIVFIWSDKYSSIALRWFLVIGFFFVLLLCGSRSSLVACLAGLIVFQLPRQPMIVILLAAASCFVVLLLIGLDLRTGVHIFDKLFFSPFGESRSAIISRLFEAMTVEQFFIGFGYESLRIFDFGLNHAHNLFLSVYFDQGFLGLAIIIWFIAALFFAGSRNSGGVDNYLRRFSLMIVGLICFGFDTSLFRSSFSFLSVFFTLFLIACHVRRGRVLGRN